MPGLAAGDTQKGGPPDGVFQQLDALKRWRSSPVRRAVMSRFFSLPVSLKKVILRAARWMVLSSSGEKRLRTLPESSVARSEVVACSES